MKVLVAEKCGFCHGVKSAIDTAEKILARENDVYSLGPIIHNRDEVERLAKAGLKTVESVEEIQSGTVIIRSHGAAPEQVAKLKEKGINIVDATCVLVKRLQHIAEDLESDGYKVVIIGDENHPEVRAVMGCVKDVVVLADESDLHKIPENTKLGIVCQTTQSPNCFGRMLGAIQSRQGLPQTAWDLFVKQPEKSFILTSRALTEGRCSFGELKVINTLCKEAIKRQTSAVQLCKQVDVMFVLGGLKSANTQRLAELCKKHNSQTYHLQNWNELDKKVLLGKNTAGVTAGASTPEWIIAEFVKNLEAFDDNR